MKIAVVGSGIAGLTSALLAHLNGHEVHLYEKNDYFGGHSNTVDFFDGTQVIPVDTGFLVHNTKTYPNLIKIFEYLKVPTTESDMTLSIKNLQDNLEWGGRDLKSVFIQKRNFLRPSFYRLIFDILKFNKSAPDYLNIAVNDKQMTLGDLLQRYSYSQELKNWYLVPMAAAIWSTPADKILDFPAWTFLQFFLNHNLLQINDRPQWRTIPGGSKVYVKKIIDLIPYKFKGAQIDKIVRTPKSFEIYRNNQIEKFDLGIMATHADQSLFLIEDIADDEKSILSQFKFQKNKAVLHTDESVLPERNYIWSAWNYLSNHQTTQVCVSYLINKLQPISTKKNILVTLNPASLISPDKIDRAIDYEHPLFDNKTVEAQSIIHQIQGKKSTYYVGAWQGYGFHEDGVNSALRVAKQLNWKIPWS